MPRVHCLECDAAVILDPRGVCPEGHHVGAPGDRVDQYLGTSTPHHDEPEPWVFRIDDAEPRSDAEPVGAGVGAGLRAGVGAGVGSRRTRSVLRCTRGVGGGGGGGGGASGCGGGGGAGSAAGAWAGSDAAGVCKATNVVGGSRGARR